jgi:hypothetical protein
MFRIADNTATTNRVELPSSSETLGKESRHPLNRDCDNALLLCSISAALARLDVAECSRVTQRRKYDSDGGLNGAPRFALCPKARPQKRDHDALHIAHSSSRTSSDSLGHNIRTFHRRCAHNTTRSARDPTPQERTEYQNAQARFGRLPDRVDYARY